MKQLLTCLLLLSSVLIVHAKPVCPANLSNEIDVMKHYISTEPGVQSSTVYIEGHWVDIRGNLWVVNGKIGLFKGDMEALDASLKKAACVRSNTQEGMVVCSYQGAQDSQFTLTQSN